MKSKNINSILEGLSSSRINEGVSIDKIDKRFEAMYKELQSDGSKRKDFVIEAGQLFKQCPIGSVCTTVGNRGVTSTYIKIKENSWEDQYTSSPTDKRSVWKDSFMGSICFEYKDVYSLTLTSGASQKGSTSYDGVSNFTDTEWDSYDGSLTIRALTSKGVTIGGKPSKGYWVDVNNKYDKEFKTLGELITYLKKSNAKYLGVAND